MYQGVYHYHFLLQDHILDGKEIANVITICKSLAAAYHSSINFARAVNEAQVQVLVCLLSFFLLWPIAWKSIFFEFIKYKVGRG